MINKYNLDIYNNYINDNIKNILFLYIILIIEWRTTIEQQISVRMFKNIWLFFKIWWPLLSSSRS